MHNKTLGATQFFASGRLAVLYKDLKGWIFHPAGLSKGLR